jgi:hypothetical protein
MVRNLALVLPKAVFKSAPQDGGADFEFILYDIFSVDNAANNLAFPTGKARFPHLIKIALLKCKAGFRLNVTLFFTQ